MAQRVEGASGRWPGMSPVRCRSMLFTLYGDYAFPRRRSVRLRGLVDIGRAVGISEVATRSAVARLAREGWLAAERERIWSRYGLTAAGRRLIDEGTRRIYAARRDDWNGEWCILTYSIPEERRAVRDKIRKRLAWLGFGAMGPGAYVSPRDAAADAQALFIEHGVDGLARVFAGRLSGPGTDRALVSECWDVDAIAKRYDAFVAHYEPMLRRVRRSRAFTDAESFAARLALTHDFRRFPYIDPGLPGKLLPAKWAGSRAQALFSGLNAVLKDRAFRFFDRIDDPHG